MSYLRSKEARRKVPKLAPPWSKFAAIRKLQHAAGSKWVCPFCLKPLRRKTGRGRAPMFCWSADCRTEAERERFREYRAVERAAKAVARQASRVAALLLVLVLFARCGPDYCPRVSQHVPSFVCYPEEVPTTCAQGRLLTCEAEPAAPLSKPSGRYVWVDSGACE